MRAGLIGAILLGSVVAGTLSEILLFRAVRPPDAMAAVLGGLWIAMPFLAAVGLALLYRRRTAPLVVLVIALLLAAPIGLSLLHACATQQEVAQQQVQNAVQPGEDPDHGPAAMRKSGAELGAAFGWGFSVLLAVFLPPLQLATVVIPTIITSWISAFLHHQATAKTGPMVAADA
jgi:hypothetical protein